MANVQETAQNARSQALEQELARARREIADLRNQNTQNAARIEAMTPVKILPRDDQPFYEIVNEPFYSPEGILYAVGARFRDLTGTIIPSDSFLPLNEAAHKRVMDWRMTLPEEDDTPSTDSILEAALEVSPLDDAGNRLAEAEYKAAVVKQAILRRNEKKGVKREPDDVALPNAIRAGQQIPMMTNVRKSAGERPRPFGPRMVEVDTQASGSALMRALEG